MAKTLEGTFEIPVTPTTFLPETLNILISATPNPADAFHISIFDELHFFLLLVIRLLIYLINMYLKLQN